MNGMPPLLLIPILPIAIVLSLSISNVNAIVVNNTDFSIEVPNGWVYRENTLNDVNILLTPNEFADLITDNASITYGLNEGGVVAELAPDRNFPIKNAPLETYVKRTLRFANTSALTYENATIEGERAIKVYVNGMDLASTSIMPNITSSVNTISYYVMHHDQPYYLSYVANTKDYQKYLPQFEQMVKSFKFMK
jgi:hypothetical protein